MAYTLRSAPASPFARKVRIGAHVVGLIDDIAIEGGPSGEGDVIYQQNPLGKIPVLVTDDGQAIYDSPVILEYLDAVTTPGMWVTMITALNTTAAMTGLHMKAMLR